MAQTKTVSKISLSQLKFIKDGFRAWRNSATERAKLKSAPVHQTRTTIPPVIDLTGATYVFNQPRGWYHAQDDLETNSTHEDFSGIELMRQVRQRFAGVVLPAHVNRQGWYPGQMVCQWRSPSSASFSKQRRSSWIRLQLLISTLLGTWPCHFTSSKQPLWPPLFSLQCWIWQTLAWKHHHTRCQVPYCAQNGLHGILHISFLIECIANAGGHLFIIIIIFGKYMRSSLSTSQH